MSDVTICDGCGLPGSTCIQDNVLLCLDCYLEMVDGLTAERDRLRAALEVAREVRPAADYHEDFGSVLWWRLPIVEPPYVGDPREDDFPRDYYTHFTCIIEPVTPSQPRNGRGRG